MTTNICFNGNRVSELLSLTHHSRTDYENIELRDLTYSVPLFTKLRSKYSDALQIKCLKFLSLEFFSKNQFIYEKGETASKYYILLKGEVSLYESKLTDESGIDSVSNSDDYYDDDDLPKLGRPRSKVIDITPELIYEFSLNHHEESSKKEKSEVVSKDLVENECKDLIEFILQTGDFESIDGKVRSIIPGCDFGQEALFPARSRRFNAVAKTDAQVACIHKMVLRKIIKDVSHERGLQVFNFLQSVSVFSKWSRYDLGRILGYFKQRFYTKGQYLFREHEVPNHAYIIIKGVFAMTKTVNAQNKEDTLRPILRNFTSGRKKRSTNIELVLRGEKEFVGTEEIIENLPNRQFSCVCNSAVAEVYEIIQNNFLKLVNPETSNTFFATLKTNFAWLRHRSLKLENREELNQSPKTSISIDRSQIKSDLKHYPGLSSVSKTLALNPKTRHSRTLTASPKVPEKNSKTIQMPKIVWEGCQTKNIHLGTLKKNNPRLAPPNFLYKIRRKLLKKVEQRPEEI